MKTAARWTTILALFAIPFLPLYVASDLFFPFITGKNFAFRILVEIALSAWILLALIDRRYRPRFSWTLVLFGGLVAWMVVANALGVHPHKAFWSNFERMDGWVMLVHVFALFMVAGSVLTVEKLWRKWWLFFVSVAALVCGYGLLQLTGAAEIHQGGVRVDASFGNAIYMAVYLMFSLFAAFWLMLASKGWLRYALIAFSVLAFVLLLFTASRGAVIGFVGGAAAAAVLWAFLARKEWGGKGALGLKLALGSLVALIVLVGGFYLVRDSAFVQGEPALARLSSIFTLNQELAVRSTIWSMAFQGAAEDPITGWGQEGFNQVFNKYYHPSLYAQEQWFDRAHNMYLDWLVAGGVPALTLFVLLLAVSMLALLRARDLTRAERVLLTSALIAYAIQALVVFDNLFSYVPLAMLLAMAHTYMSRPIERIEKAPELSSETGVGMATAGVAVVAIALVWTVNIPNIRAAHHLVYAVSPSSQGLSQNIALFKTALADGSFASQEIREQLVYFANGSAGNQAAPMAARTELVTLAVEEMGKEVALSPNDARLRVQYASIFEIIGDKEESLAQVDTAIALSPRKQTLHINRGFKLYELGRMEEAREAFRTAYELDPSFDELAVAVASGYIITGDVMSGKALLTEAISTTTPNNESLFFAYYQAKQWNELVAVARTRVAEENGSAVSRYRLAQALAAAGRFEEARLEIVMTMATFPETRVQGEALMAQMFVQ